MSKHIITDQNKEKAKAIIDTPLSYLKLANALDIEVKAGYAK